MGHGREHREAADGRDLRDQMFYDSAERHHRHAGNHLGERPVQRAVQRVSEVFGAQQASRHLEPKVDSAERPLQLLAGTVGGETFQQVGVDHHRPDCDRDLVGALPHVAVVHEEDCQHRRRSHALRGRCLSFGLLKDGRQVAGPYPEGVVKRAHQSISGLGCNPLWKRPDDPRPHRQTHPLRRRCRLCPALSCAPAIASVRAATEMGIGVLPDSGGWITAVGTG
mmetsp:Transcript_154963/g.496631  ORF Transcript_154963/g.496631 Transcript_154963/m.496631 type:complete len:224 (+) Transcript_154963:1009-1680(+)